MVGFTIKNKESFNSAYICSRCSLLLRDPVQLIDCGHRICQSCADVRQGDLITCPECHEKTRREKVQPDRGLKNDMKILLIICSLCSWGGLLKNYPDHLDQIHPNPICGYSTEEFSLVNDLSRHQQYICEQVSVSCALKQFGCEETILRSDLNKHYRSEQHQRILMNIVHHLNHSSAMTINRSLTMENTTIQFQEIDETTNILSNGVIILNDDVQRLTTESSGHQHAFDSLPKDSSILKISCEAQDALSDGTTTNQELLHQDLALIGHKMKDMKTCSYDGTLVWKITDVHEKIVAAQSETQASIYSPPFYSSPTGCKMCLRLYPAGDGNARGTHMSLFFALMRGEYDAIPKFPFHFKVIFCLYDQTSEQRHIIDSFRPDIKSNSFQRPRSDMNIPSGIPKFVPLKTLRQENNPYIRDDTMFIKVMLDFEEIPKTLLPYVLSLNPGLPTPTQQTMVRQEIVRRQQQLPISPQANADTEQTLTVNLQEATDNDETIDPVNNDMTD